MLRRCKHRGGILSPRHTTVSALARLIDRVCRARRTHAGRRDITQFRGHLANENAEAPTYVARFCVLIISLSSRFAFFVASFLAFLAVIGWPALARISRGRQPSGVICPGQCVARMAVLTPVGWACDTRAALLPRTEAERLQVWTSFAIVSADVAKEMWIVCGSLARR